MRRFLLLFAVLVMGALPALAQGPKQLAPKDSALYFGEAGLQNILKTLPPAFSKRLFDGGVFNTAFIRLEKPDQPHAHGTWSEVLVVKQGSGVITTGGKIGGTITHNSNVHVAIFTDADRRAENTGPNKDIPGDIAGTTLEGGKDQKVSPGDVIFIPAGLAHRWSAVRQPIVYLDIKFPKAK